MPLAITPDSTHRRGTGKPLKEGDGELITAGLHAYGNVD